MLELYRSVNSICAQKVRVALAEKGLEYREHLIGEQIDERLSRSPMKKRTEYKRDVALNGLDSRFAREALEHHVKLLDMIEAAGGGWLAGPPWRGGVVPARPGPPFGKEGDPRAHDARGSRPVQKSRAAAGSLA